MTRVSIFCLLFVCISIVEAERTSISIAAPLAGCWQGTDEPGTLEQWMVPAGGMMLGMSRTVRMGKVSEFEFMRIVEDQGKMLFIAILPNQPETVFTLIKSSPHELVFENPEHDFPQRILYRLSGKDVLTARIEGMNNGKSLAFDYPMKRASCP